MGRFQPGSSDYTARSLPLALVNSPGVFGRLGRPTGTVMTKTALRFLLSLAALTAGRTTLHAQTFTYHVHQEPSARVGMMQLKSAGPDTAVKLWTSAPQVGQIRTIRVFDLPVNVPDLGRVIPKGTTVTFTLWMRITAARGTVYPAATLLVNWPSDAPSQELCAAQGTTAEGTLNGTADSQIAIVVPPDPRISSVAPTSGSSGTLVTVNGHNFGSTQGSSRFTISGLDVTPQSWSATQIAAQIPDGVNHGPIQVTVDGLTSNPWMFIGAWDDAQCQVTLAPSKLRITMANGGSNTLSVTADPGCAWSIQGLPGWLSAAPMTGTGTSSVLLSATANPSNAARTGTVSVNSVPAAVLQNGKLGAPLFWTRRILGARLI